jgi:hypothetical protein
MTRFACIAFLASSFVILGCGGSDGSDGAPTGDGGADVTLETGGDSGARDSAGDSTGDSATPDTAIADTAVASDAGDARDATDADETREGGLPEGSDCTSTPECASGLACCYPCGIPGCHDKCIKVDADGKCPLFP